MSATTPLSLYKHASSFGNAGNMLLRERFDDIFPIIFLHCRAIELYLKSFLLQKDISTKEIKTIGHDLDKLLAAALDKGIWELICGHPLTISRVRAIVRIMNDDYKSKRLEYRISGHVYKTGDADFTRILITRLKRGLSFLLHSTADA